MACVDGLHHTFVDVLKEVADCEYPPYITPQMAGELAQVYHMVVYRRMEHRGWTFALPQNSDSKTQAYRIADRCNIQVDRRRKLKQYVAPQANDDEEVTLRDGTVLPPSRGRRDCAGRTGMARGTTPSLAF